jgi:hypothetical protein
MDDEPDGYQTYVIRLWRARCQGKWQWRASIESRYTGERQVFASLAQLFAYMTDKCESQSPDVQDQANKEAKMARQ